MSDRARAYELGWEWFQLHAQQRMQLVSFWFLAMSFLFSGAVMAYVGGEPWLGTLVAGAIVGSSWISYLLDLRTQELIAYGERVMSAAEATLRDDFDLEEFRLASDMHDTRRSAPSYRRLFAALYLGASLLGVTIGVVGIATS